MERRGKKGPLVSSDRPLVLVSSSLDPPTTTPAGDTSQQTESQSAGRSGTSTVQQTGKLSLPRARTLD